MSEERKRRQFWQRTEAVIRQQRGIAFRYLAPNGLRWTDDPCEAREIALAIVADVLGWVREAVLYEGESDAGLGIEYRFWFGRTCYASQYDDGRDIASAMNFEVSRRAGWRSGKRPRATQS